MSNQTQAKSSGKLLATGGILGAILASSCCILPLVLITFGVSGAWIGNLHALEPYKPIFIVITLGFLAAGFWHVYFKKPKPCEDDSYCAKPASSRVTKLALWIGSAMVLLALTIDYWAPLFY
ncbi:MAG: mercury transporter MerT [Alphaproteobacteria bacterium]|nr:MAG: mercury transporter MerT [Alphaproteobacteria bacterium]